jgi:hypothetical protein
MNVTTASTAELLAFYNANATKPVARFSDRKTAERRVNALLVIMTQAAVRPKAVQAEYKPGTCPNCGATSDITCGQVVDTKRGQHVVNEHEAFCHSCCHEFNYDTGRAIRRRAQSDNATRSAAIAASWTDKRVAAARATRHAVRVTDPRGGQGSYKSVREAFMVLALPLGQHIKFRGALKAAGKGEFSGFKFKLVERQ